MLERFAWVDVVDFRGFCTRLRCCSKTHGFSGDSYIESMVGFSIIMIGTLLTNALILFSFPDEQGGFDFISSIFYKNSCRNEMKLVDKKMVVGFYIHKQCNRVANHE